MAPRSDYEFYETKRDLAVVVERLDQLEEKVDSLNVKLDRILEAVTGHEARIQRLEESRGRGTAVAKWLLGAVTAVVVGLLIKWGLR